MISTYRLQQLYIHLYQEFMQYIWDWDTVYTLAELETAIFQVFPDISKISKLLQRLQRCVVDARISDEYLDSCIDEFLAVIQDDVDVYLKLDVPQEVLK